MIRRNYFIPEEIHKRLEKLSKRTGDSMGEHTRRAIEQYLDRVEHFEKIMKGAKL